MSIHRILAKNLFANYYKNITKTNMSCHGTLKGPVPFIWSRWFINKTVRHWLERCLSSVCKKWSNWFDTFPSNCRPISLPTVMDTSMAKYKLIYDRKYSSDTLQILLYLFYIDERGIFSFMVNFKLLPSIFIILLWQATLFKKFHSTAAFPSSANGTLLSNRHVSVEWSDKLAQY